MPIDSEWFKGRIRWTSLRSVGNSPIVKLTVIIPLIGYLILFNENVLKYLDLSHELFGRHGTTVAGLADGHAHVPWRLLLIYFGFCFLGVASTIYSWLCPQEAKKYDSGTDYIEQTADSVSFIEIGQIRHRLEHGDERARSSLRELAEFDGGRPTPDGLEEFRKRRAEFEAAMLDLYFQYLNRMRPAARLACFLFYTIGFVSLVIPSLEVFFKVSVLLARQISA